MENLYLVYVNSVGKNYKGNYIYEFIFSDTTVNIDGEEWDAYPASGRPEPPHHIFIKKVGKLETDLKFDVIQNNDSFGVWDAVDGLISLAWENIDGYESYPEPRLHFRFGKTLDEIESILYQKDLILDYNENKHEKQEKNK
jgi:hypothetical protein